MLRHLESCTLFISSWQMKTTPFFDNQNHRCEHEQGKHCAWCRWPLVVHRILTLSCYLQQWMRTFVFQVACDWNHLSNWCSNAKPSIPIAAVKLTSMGWQVSFVSLRNFHCSYCNKEKRQRHGILTPSAV